MVMQNIALFEGHPIGFNPDPNHAVKGLKNFLINKRQLTLSQEEVDEFGLPSNIVDYQAIEDLVEFTSTHEMNISHQVSKAVLKKAADRYGKMDVGATIKIFSEDTAAALDMMLEANKFSNGTYPDSYFTTAHWIRQVARWIKIMGARGFPNSFSHHDMEQYEKQVQFLRRFAYLTSKVVFTTRQAVAIANGVPPCLEIVQKSILVSCESTIRTAERILQDPEVSYWPGGRGSGDPVESHHGHMKVYQKTPSPTQVKTFSKIISISQFLTRVNGSNVSPDDNEFLTEFSDIKKMRDLEMAEENEDIEHFVVTRFDPNDFSDFHEYVQANALTYFIGYVFYKTILTYSKCDICKKAYINDDPNFNDQYVNHLIIEKEWSQGSLTHPNKVANQVFHLVEALFKSNRDKYLNQKNIKEKMVTFLHGQIVEQFSPQEVPRCHIRLLISRFIKGRLFFWANFMNKSDKELVENQELAYNESFSSKSQRAKTIPELQ